MCYAKMVAIDQKESDDDDSFERVEHDSSAETTDAEEEDQLELLETALVNAHLEIKRLLKEKESDRKWKFTIHLTWFTVGLALLICSFEFTASNVCKLNATHSYSSPDAAACPQAAPECPKVPECPKTTGEREIHIEHYYDAEGRGIRAPLNFGFKDGFVTEVVPGSHAEAAGLEVGDQILNVKGYDVRNSTAEELYKLLCWDWTIGKMQHIFGHFFGYSADQCKQVKQFMRLIVQRNVTGLLNSKRMQHYVEGNCFGAILTLLAVFTAYLMWSMKRAIEEMNCLHEDEKVGETQKRDAANDEKNESEASIDKEDEYKEEEMKEIEHQRRLQEIRRKVEEEASEETRRLKKLLQESEEQLITVEKDHAEFWEDLDLLEQMLNKKKDEFKMNEYSWENRPWHKMNN